MENKNIYSAFVKAQKGFMPLLKASLNPHYKSKYSNLADCIESVITSLNENGIGFIQTPKEAQGGVCIETIFIHESGEKMSGGELFLPASKNDPQGYGSALTYARRYGLMAACGIAAEDDDGNAASIKKAPQKAEEKPKILLNSELFNSAIKHIASGGDIRKIKEKYHIDQAIENVILAKVAELKQQEELKNQTLNKEVENA